MFYRGKTNKLQILSLQDKPVKIIRIHLPTQMHFSKQIFASGIIEEAILTDYLIKTV